MLKAMFHTHNEKGSGVYYSMWDSHWGAYHQMERPNTFPVGLVIGTDQRTYGFLKIKDNYMEVYRCGV